MEPKPSPESVDQQIFDSYFRTVLDEETFQRVSAIFKAVAKYNERSVALQFFTGLETGKLEEVIAAYDEILHPDSPIHEVDEIQRATGIRHFADYVYLQVICEGDPGQLFAMRPRDTPPIFDEMGKEHQALN